MKRNRWIRRFVIIVAVLFVVSRIVYVNRKYPQVEYKDIPIGETAEWDHNVNLTVETAKVYNQAEAVDKGAEHGDRKPQPAVLHGFVKHGRLLLTE